MNAYVERVIAGVKERHGNEPEFVQTVEEVLSSLSPVIDRHPEYEKADLLTRMVEPERMFTFRVVWMDDAGNYHTNTGYRCQFMRTGYFCADLDYTGERPVFNRIVGLKDSFKA